MSILQKEMTRCTFKKRAWHRKSTQQILVPFLLRGKSTVSPSPHGEDGIVIVCLQPGKTHAMNQEINEWICQQETLLFLSPCQACFPRDNAFLWITQQPLSIVLSGRQHVYSQNAHFTEVSNPLLLFLQT